MSVWWADVDAACHGLKISSGSLSQMLALEAPELRLSVDQKYKTISHNVVKVGFVRFDPCRTPPSSSSSVPPLKPGLQSQMFGGSPSF